MNITQPSRSGRWRRLVAWWRLYWGFCPECDSSAPEMDTCKVCKGWWSGATGNSHPPPQQVLDDWRRRYDQARCRHGYPMEDDCPESQTISTPMKPQSQPTYAYRGPRMERLTVREVKEALSKIPDDAWIQCGDGGFLEVPVHLASGEVKLETYVGSTQPVVKVHWQ